MPQRREPPEGYITATEAFRILDNAMLYRYVEKGLITPYGPPTSKHKYYPLNEVQAVRDANLAFYAANQEQAPTSTEAHFAEATPDDMDGLYKMAVKLFPKTADGERRREWMTVEPRGYYIMKTPGGRVVAYFYLLSLRPERLAAYLHDELPSRSITRYDITPYLPGKPVQACVLGGIGSDPDLPEETRKAYVASLLRGIRHSLERLGQEGIIIPKFYAFSETVEGIALCLKLGMSQWEPPHRRRLTFVLDTFTSRAPFLRDYKTAIATWKQSRPERQERPVTTSPVAHTPVHQKAHTAPREPRQVAISHPPDTLTLRELAARVQRDEKTLLTHMRKFDKEPEKYPQFAHVRIPVEARPGWYSRYFTPEQAGRIATWIAKHTRK